MFRVLFRLSIEGLCLIVATSKSDGVEDHGARSCQSAVALVGSEFRPQQPFPKQGVASIVFNICSRLGHLVVCFLTRELGKK